LVLLDSEIAGYLLYNESIINNVNMIFCTAIIMHM